MAVGYPARMETTPPDAPTKSGATTSKPSGASKPEPLPLLEDANDVLTMDDIGSEYVDVPEWDRRLLVVGMTGIERDGWEQSRMVERRNQKGRVRREMDLLNLRASLVALTVRKPSDPTVRVFDDTLLVQLGNKSAAALERVFDAARKLSGLTDDDIDELTDDLKDDPSGGRGSTSR